MAQDQNITYRVNLDDSSFQAKLTQMRASLDSTVGGGGSNFGRSMAYLGPMGGGGMGAYGGDMQPISYTPPAIAMQPHYGMFQIQQTLSQAGLSGAFGPAGIALNQFRTFGIGGGRDFVPPNMSYSEYSDYSSRAFASRMGSTASAAFNTGIGLAGDVAGGLIGTGVSTMLGLGTFGSLALSGLGGAGISTIASSVADRSAAMLGIQSTLEAGSFRFYQGSNTDSVTGRGFNRSDRTQISKSIGRMEAGDTRLNMSDYRNILESGSEMGLFEGTKDVKDFEKKFKDLVSTVKTVTSTLHTTLKEGMETIRGLRDMGVTDAVGQQSMIMRSETLGRTAGRTGMEMMAVGQAGAEIFRGTGVSMQRGFELNQQNTALVRQMMNQGTLSRESIGQAGGELALGQQMTANALGAFQNPHGLAALRMSFNPATGQLDPSMIANMSGKDFMSIASRGAGLSARSLFKLEANQRELVGDLSPMQMQVFGIESRMSEAKMLSSASGIDIKDAYKVRSLREGVSPAALDAELGMMRTNPEELRKQYNTQIGKMAEQQSGEVMRSNYYGYKKAATMYNRFIQPIAEGGINAGSAIAGGLEESFGDIKRSWITGEVNPANVGYAAISNAQEIRTGNLREKIQAAKASGMAGSELESYARGAISESRGAGTVTDVSGDLLNKLKGEADSAGVTGIGQTRTLGGLEFTARRSKSEAETIARQQGVTAIGFYDRRGRYMSSTSDQAGAAVETALSYRADPKKLKEYSDKKGKLTDEQLLTMPDSALGLLQLVTGDKSASFATTRLKPEQAVKLAHLGRETGMTEEIEEMANAGADTTSQARIDINRKADERIASLKGDIRMDSPLFAGTAIRDRLFTGEKKIYNALKFLSLKPGDEAGLKRRLGEDYEAFKSEFGGRNAETIQKDLSKMDEIVKIQSTLKTTAGPDATVLSVATGATNMEALMKMSAVLKSQLEILTNMQKGLDASFTGKAPTNAQKPKGH